MTSMATDIKVVDDLTDISRTAADIILQQICSTLLTSDFFSLALSGGSTPHALYSLLARDPDYCDRVPWGKVHFFWGDERHVPSDHDDSNFLLANRSIFSHVPVPPKNIHHLPVAESDAGIVAKIYEKELRDFFQFQPGQLPRFNCILLGMGADGHTASLFPGTEALHKKDRLVVANWVAKLQANRITMTVPLINHADLIIFLVSGEKKAKMLHNVIEGRQNPDLYPAQSIQPVHGNLIWIVDSAAASCLGNDF
jgi:6-phosphogluconolactonase